MDNLFKLIEVQVDIIDDHEDLRDDCESGSEDYRYYSAQIAVHMEEFTVLAEELIRIIERDNIELRRQLRIRGTNKHQIRRQLKDHNEAIDIFHQMMNLEFFEKKITVNMEDFIELERTMIMETCTNKKEAFRNLHNQIEEHRSNYLAKMTKRLASLRMRLLSPDSDYDTLSEEIARCRVEIQEAINKLLDILDKGQVEIRNRYLIADGNQDELWDMYEERLERIEALRYRVI